jgi:hypothetical protein
MAAAVRMIDKQSYRPNRGEGDENQRRMRIAEESKEGPDMGILDETLE